MSINFPINPAVDQIYSYEDRSWRWTGEYWRSVTTSIGYSGSQGDLGYTGSQGDTGFTGSRGEDGIIGVDGYTGSQGIQGDTGFTGSRGEDGTIGVDGYTGSQGIQGDTGYTGSQGDLGYTGSQGDTGLGFRIAKSYASVAALEADTAPTGIVAGEFAIVETGDVEDAENSRLYLWTGTSYTYVTDLSGASGITGPQGDAGYTGSQGDLGFTGSQGDQGIQGDVGFVGSQGDLGYTGSQGDVGYVGSEGYTGSQGESSFTWGNTAPVSPSIGDRWYNTNESILLVYVDDGDSQQWVEVAASGFLGPQGYTGSSGGISTGKAIAMTMIFGGG